MLRLILRSVLVRSPIVLLSSFYRPSIILLSFFYCEAETIRKQYGNNTEWSEGRAKDERMRIGGTRVINLTIIYL